MCIYTCVYDSPVSATAPPLVLIPMLILSLMETPF